MKKFKKGLIIFGKSIRGLAETFGFLTYIIFIFGYNENGTRVAINTWNDSVSKNGVVITIALIIGLFVCGYGMDCTINTPINKKR